MAMSLREGGEPMRVGRSGSARDSTAIIPRNSISGRALIAVVAIMSFLASLTTGAVMLVRIQAAEWQSDISREVTIQVRPGPGRDLDAEVGKAAAAARTFPGILDVRVYSKQESAQLLEPWLGAGLRLDELPVPRMIVLKVASGAAAPNLERLRQLVETRATGATLDDHRGWVDRLRTMAGTAIAGGIGILLLVFAATILSVTFATRGAMASTRPIIEVLHFVGARDSFIARHFQHHFLLLGLQGGAIGGGAALLLFALAQLIGAWSAGTAPEEEMAALFGSFAIGLTGFLAVVAQIVLFALVTAATSRHTVNKTLATIE